MSLVEVYERTGKCVILVGKKTQGLLDEFYGRENSRVRSGFVFYSCFASPTINESILIFSVDELSSHASVVNIKTTAPRTNFYFHPVSMARVSEILSNLNVRKPVGLDGIPPKLLKIAAPVIAGPMTKLFNYCIDVGEWPCQWKLSNVTPVHKKTTKHLRRTIALLVSYQLYPRCLRNYNLINYTAYSHQSFRIICQGSCLGILAVPLY